MNTLPGTPGGDLETILHVESFASPTIAAISVTDAASLRQALTNLAAASQTARAAYLKAQADRPAEQRGRTLGV